MKKNIKTIINENDDLHFIKIDKPNKRDRNTWTFSITDKTSELYGINGHLSDYNYQLVTLRRGNHYFLTYKIKFNNKFEYFIDTRKALHRKTTELYVDNLINYYVYSNDISILKNVPSFKFTKQDMEQNNIDNFLDLCAYFGKYSAIGTGYTRDLRNLVVLDIDVDCTKEPNKNALDELIIKFAKCNSIPDFYIFNHESNHVQLQWLIKSIRYKDIDENVKNELIINLKKDKNKSKEIKSNGIDFTKLTTDGINYRLFTRALTDIVPKHKFGDKNYTFWKAKNFYSAYLGLFNLELKVPLYDGKELYYMSNDEIKYNFATKEGRKRYYDEAPTLEELSFKTKELVNVNTQKVQIKKIEKIKDDDCILIETKHKKTYGNSRNDFVLICSRETTWEMSREYGLRNNKDVSNLSETEFNRFKRNVFKTVKKRFKEEDLKYKGHWPGTTNMSKYNDSEFEGTFNGSFNYAIQHLNCIGYTNEQRTKSSETRHIGMEIHLSLVDYIRQNNKKISRSNLLNKVNNILETSGQKKISLSSLKRYINESKCLTTDERNKLYENIFNNYKDRQLQLNNALHNKNERQINTCKKRCEYIDINIIRYLNGESV